MTYTRTESDFCFRQEVIGLMLVLSAKIPIYVPKTRRKESNLSKQGQLTHSMLRSSHQHTTKLNPVVYSTLHPSCILTFYVSLKLNVFPKQDHP